MKPVLNGFNLRIIPPREQWDEDEACYERHISAIQLLRGSVYLEDGAIPREALDTEGRHCSEWDERSYHICAWTKAGALVACLRLIVHRKALSGNELCMAPVLGRLDQPLQGQAMSALEATIHRARQESIGFGEIGGWALSAEYRHNRHLWLMPLITYSLHEYLGSVLGVIHATHRHRSAEILRQFGAESLNDGEVPLPPHFDSYYNCNMEILSFDSRTPPERFKPVINAFLAAIRNGHRSFDQSVIEKHLAA